ncbi:MAG: RNA polymerase sigma factor [Elusimicrobia bacterium]|nr:RNA polymerase sigma factor [Elusimicrobiota bacterium]
MSEQVRDVDQLDVQASRQGDGDAYGRIIQRHQGEIARRMWRFTRNSADHAELVQDVFVNAYLSLPGYRNLAPFSHWLHKIAVRTGYAYWRRRVKESALAQKEYELRLLSQAPAGHDAAQAAELVHHALERLPPRDRLVLTLMCLEGHTLDEIAQLTGWSLVMVKVQAWRARAKLKKILDQEVVK